MLETKEPAIKLFGRKILFPGEDDLHTIAGGDSASSSAMDIDHEEEEEDGEGGGVEQESLEEDEDQEENKDPQAETEKAKKVYPSPEEEAKNSGTSTEAIVNPKTPSIDEEIAKSKSGKPEKETNSREKTLKKPDKVLPCPRCKSTDTKFCYYNNYNINQPRYFCKACQRYWTAGGTMRNVPVGAGRRKHKNCVSHYRNIIISEALQAARIDSPNGTHHLPSLKTSGRVLSFGLDPQICDSMASVLNLAEKNVLNGKRNGFHHGFEDQRIPPPCKSGENIVDECSSASSITVSNSNGESGKNSCNGFIHQVPCFPSVPWAYPWNSHVPWAYPCIPSAPAAFWDCGVPGNWNFPWFSSHSSASNPRSPSSGPNSPTLGKHSRDGDMINQDNFLKEEPPKQRNGCVLVPKTLRIDDPNEAAKSSIWETLGVKNESVSGGGMFNKAFQSKKEEKNHVVETSPVLWANPAALFRSLNFHENS